MAERPDSEALGPPREESPTRDHRFIVGGQPVPAPPVAPGLHIVATPIGRLADITLQALAVLARADLVLAEDTRLTQRLLDHYGIAARMRRHDRHREEAEAAALVEQLRAGATFALVSDAGTPLLSDPGRALVRAAIAGGVAVHAAPGPSALLAALVVAGLPTETFTFAGFLPEKPGERRRRLRALSEAPGTLVLYEAPHRVLDSLADMASLLGDRPAVVARELTKMFETVTRGPLTTLAASIAAQPLKGEFVILVGPAAAAEASEEELDGRLAAALARHSVKDAAAIVAGELGLPRRAVYARALRLTAGDPP